MRRLTPPLLALCAACTFSPPAATTLTSPECGNGAADEGEVCDDGNLDEGDGCDASCDIENGWRCDQWPSVCTNPDPIAQPDSMDVLPMQRKRAAVLDNDSDPEGEGLRVTDVTPANFGEAMVFVGTEIEYLAGAARGVDRLEYTIRDASGNRASAVLTVRVGVDNRAPTANDLSVSTSIDVATTIRLEGSDPDGDPLSFEIVAPPTRGTLAGPTSDEVTYTPPAGETGQDHFTYVATDGTLFSDVATATITIGPGTWWDADWSKRRLVTIDTTQLSPVTDLPVRIALSSAELISDGATVNGADVRFVSIDDTTAYDHELVEWNTDLASAWVKLPTVDVPQTTFWLYYGNPGAAAVDETQVWTAHHAVFHLERSLFESATRQTRRSNRVHVDTVEGQGIDLLPTQDLNVALPSGYDDSAGYACAWVEVDTNDHGNRLWELRETTNQNRDRIAVRLDDMGRWELDLEAGDEDVSTQGTNATADGWHYACLQWDQLAKTMRLYVDGQLEVEDLDPPSFSVGELRFGSNNIDGYSGSFDEVWLAKAQRTAEWFRARTVLGLEDRVSIGASERTPE